MSDKSAELIVYEELGRNKSIYLSFINDFLSRIDASIASHDLNRLNSVFDEFLKLPDKERRPLLYSSSTFRIQAIKKALNMEYNAGFKLFWDDISDVEGLFNKYNKTIFMIRRITSSLPEEYKQEALSYLQTISPYIIYTAFDDPTVRVGKPDYVYISLSMEFMKNHHYHEPLILLQFINEKNSEILQLINQLEYLIRNDA